MPPQLGTSVTHLGCVNMSWEYVPIVSKSQCQDIPVSSLLDYPLLESTCTVAKVVLKQTIIALSVKDVFAGSDKSEDFDEFLPAVEYGQFYMPFDPYDPESYEDFGMGNNNQLSYV
ncbi:unnamed protein product [Polarella glacialis]|uniref:Uncharacterized protein n=1 Tax=Polarella glacialis TaxID=89957 RepID=A0A813IKB5_POLGL|nr:unnamed protein product [Polarella glacialis]